MIKWHSWALKFANVFDFSCCLIQSYSELTFVVLQMSNLAFFVNIRQYSSSCIFADTFKRQSSQKQDCLKIFLSFYEFNILNTQKSEQIGKRFTNSSTTLSFVSSYGWSWTKSFAILRLDLPCSRSMKTYFIFYVICCINSA